MELYKTIGDCRAILSKSQTPRLFFIGYQALLLVYISIPTHIPDRILHCPGRQQDSNGGLPGSQNKEDGAIVDKSSYTEIRLHSILDPFNDCWRLHKKEACLDSQTLHLLEMLSQVQPAA